MGSNTLSRKTRSDKGVRRGSRSETDTKTYPFRLYNGPERDWFDNAVSFISQDRNIPIGTAIREVVLELIHAYQPETQSNIPVQVNEDTQHTIHELRTELTDLRKSLQAFINDCKQNRIYDPATEKPSSDSVEVDNELIGNILMDFSLDSDR
jgi:hypothetical protein